MKKRSDRRKHCALAVVRWSQKFSPGRRPPSRGAGRPKFNQLEMVTTVNYRPSLVKINARPPVANTQTGPITIHCAAKLSVQCNITNLLFFQKQTTSALIIGHDVADIAEHNYNIWTTQTIGREKRIHIHLIYFIFTHLCLSAPLCPRRKILLLK